MLRSLCLIYYWLSVLAWSVSAAPISEFAAPSCATLAPKVVALGEGLFNYTNGGIVVGSGPFLYPCASGAMSKGWGRDCRYNSSFAVSSVLTFKGCYVLGWEEWPRIGTGTKFDKYVLRVPGDILIAQPLSLSVATRFAVRGISTSSYTSIGSAAVRCNWVVGPSADCVEDIFAAKYSYTPSGPPTRAKSNLTCAIVPDDVNKLSFLQRVLANFSGVVWRRSDSYDDDYQTYSNCTSVFGFNSSRHEILSGFANVTDVTFWDQPPAAGVPAAGAPNSTSLFFSVVNVNSTLTFSDHLSLSFRVL